MPLLTLFATAPDSIALFTVEQVVSAAGDGVLKDHSACSTELRDYLSKVGTSKLTEYLDHCLSSPFPKSGMVLQDLVNEFGRRLDYHVTNGRYQGVQGQIGFDGLWLSPEDHSLVVEVKTTDVYRISLDNLAGYHDKLSADGKLSSDASILIVVGRQDTGELEAQIRGSRHAWDIRVISAEALIKLVLLKEDAEAVETGVKMRSLLTPIEYTRLDRMVDVMFSTARDVEEPEPEIGPGDPGPIPASGLVEAATTNPSKGPWVFTDKQLLQSKRENIIAALGRREASSLIRKSRALYWNAGHDVRAACAMSKRYTGKNQAPYWYAYHPQWAAFLEEGERTFYILGCMDLDRAFAVPHSTMKSLLPHLHTTTKGDATYWHVHVIQTDAGLSITLPKLGDAVPLEPYEFSII